MTEILNIKLSKFQTQISQEFCNMYITLFSQNPVKKSSFWVDCTQNLAEIKNKI